MYEITKDLYDKNKKLFESKRPTDAELDAHFSVVNSFLDEILEECFELKEVFKQRKRNARYYREEQNHLLFRPVGQRAFARATQLLTSRGLDTKGAVSELLKADMNISSNDWHNILWDPIGETMITSKLVMAETQLLRLCGHEARTMRNAQSLDDLINLRG